MKQQLLEQYKHIQAILKSNVDTIGSLIRQAESLSLIAENLSGADQASMDTKEQLTTNIDRVQESIDKLITQTQELFVLYDKFADELFSK
jgi:ABC-type transporter Mla subunit MlaD